MTDVRSERAPSPRTPAEPRRAGVLEDVALPVKVKIAALWAATMLLFAYGDIFGLLRPGGIDGIRAGKTGGFRIDQLFLGWTAVYVAIPSVMVFLCLVLKPTVNRWTNIVLGAVYAVSILAAVIGEGWGYYIFLSILETALAALVVWYAWTWPRQAAPTA
ncbi:MAG: DUF6326 family protein [Blastococcus sp.]